MFNTKEDELVRNMSNFLYAEVKEGLSMLQESDNQYLRRSFIRALFASIESVIYGMKTEILNRIRNGQQNFTTGEMAILEEKSYILDKSGKVIESPKYIEIKKNIRFVFQAYGKSYGAKINIKVDDSNWESFIKLVDIRNRITHPKNSNDIIISDEEIHISILVSKWFSVQHINSINVTTRSLQNEINDLKKRYD